ncbi:MAG TPA: RluA family pseudouridine synthase [Candidatus Magasanikbacteria bacterium]|nr:RluA family pseudouridine synthase [Candidatus Magasanikbacteria bacterium]
MVNIVEKERKIVIPKRFVGRLDIFLTDKLGLSRTSVKNTIDSGTVTVNGKLPRKAGDRVKPGDIVILHVEVGGEEDVVVDEKIIPKIIAQTRNWAVVEKPAGMLTHPTQAGETGTLADWIREKYPETKRVGDEPKMRPGIVHRLDREASGLLVIARNQKMFSALKEQFSRREIEKEYFVLVYGQVPREHETIDFAIGRAGDGHMAARPKVDATTLHGAANLQEGKLALTEFDVVKMYARFSLLKVKIHTGRTHQIRVHMFAYNHPVVGDTIYFNRKLMKKIDAPLNRLFLHSAHLCFTDLSGEKCCFDSALPPELSEYLNTLKRYEKPLEGQR